MSEQLIASEVAHHDGESRIEVAVGGNRIAIGSVHLDGCGVVVSLDVAHGHVPLAARRALVDALFDLPALREAVAVEIALPLGDAELLGALRDHLNSEISTRAAGSTCLMECRLQSLDNADPSARAPREGQ